MTITLRAHMRRAPVAWRDTHHGQHQRHQRRQERNAVPGSGVVCRLFRQLSVSTTVNTHAIYSPATLLKHLVCLG